MFRLSQDAKSVLTAKSGKESQNDSAEASQGFRAPINLGASTSSASSHRAPPVTKVQHDPVSSGSFPSSGATASGLGASSVSLSADSRSKRKVDNGAEGDLSQGNIRPRYLGTGLRNDNFSSREGKRNKNVHISTSSASSVQPFPASSSSSSRSSAISTNPLPRPPSLSALTLRVSPRQRRNPLLKCIQNVPCAEDPTINADFVMSPTACAFFISLRYHLLNPQYLKRRIIELRHHSIPPSDLLPSSLSLGRSRNSGIEHSGANGSDTSQSSGTSRKASERTQEAAAAVFQGQGGARSHTRSSGTINDNDARSRNENSVSEGDSERMRPVIAPSEEELLLGQTRNILGAEEYRLKVILCLVDVEDNEVPIKELNRLAIQYRCTLLLSWSLLEAARYLETFKAYEKKSATAIMERKETEYLPQLQHCLTTIRSVNKSDVTALITTFGSLAGILKASIEQLALVPGLGHKKVRRIYEALHQPFNAQRTRQRLEERQKREEEERRQARRGRGELSLAEEEVDGEKSQSESEEEPNAKGSDGSSDIEREGGNSSKELHRQEPGGVELWGAEESMKEADE